MIETNVCIHFYIDRNSKSFLEVIDEASMIKVATIRLTNDQVCSILSNTMTTGIKAAINNDSRLGKTMVNENMKLELPFDSIYPKDLKKVHEFVVQNTPEGWIPDEYYGSKNSFVSEG